MNKQKVVLVMILFVFFLFPELSQKIYACGCGSHPSTPSPAHHSVPLPIMVPPMPEFERTWKAEDVFDSLKEKGLSVQQQETVIEEDTGYVENTADEVLRYELPLSGEKAGLFIHTFNSRDALEKVQRHFLDLNQAGELYTWSFVKDNVVLVMNGIIPEKVARQYEAALYDLKE